MRWRDKFRELPGGPGLAGKTVTIRKRGSPTVVASPTTGADGAWEYQADGSPGPLEWEGEHNGAVRRGATDNYGPAGPVQVGELHLPLKAMGDGVIAGHLNGLGVTAGASGLTVNAATGGALAGGVIYANYAADVLALAAAGALPRIDLVVVRAWPAGTADEGRCELAVITGAPAATPAAPLPTRTAALWEVPLAEVRVEAGASAIGAEKISDRRSYVLQGTSQQRHPVVAQTARRSSASVDVGSTTGIDIPALNLNPVLLAGVVYDIAADAGVLCSAATAVDVEIAPFIGGRANAAPFRGHAVTGSAETTNSHDAVVLGTGAPVSCGVLIRRIGGGADGRARYTTGVLSVRAFPR